MLYHSTNNPAHQVSLKEAILRSLPPDNGLYMPNDLPKLGQDFWSVWKDLSFQEIGYAIAEAFFGEDVPEEPLSEMVDRTLAFDAPTIQIAPNRHVLELFHGPTLAFKDFGARFMARLMSWLTRNDDQRLTVLVATSGDTGGAVASAFHNVPNTRVVILYPKGKVSGLQEKQLTTLGGNVDALEINGTFDDCQRLVKAAFLDRELSERMNLTSANSINLARLVPQSFYYIHSARSITSDLPPTFVIPSGNFGNLTAGLLARQLGLPIERFVAATNINDVVPQYLSSGNYEPRQSQATLSNAMDVGAPSNFARMQALFGHSWEEMVTVIDGLAFSDEETRTMIRRTREETGYVIDPHGAVGLLAAEAWSLAHPGYPTITLETAHPAKFLDVMETELGKDSVEIPERLAILANREKTATAMNADESTFKDWLTAC